MTLDYTIRGQVKITMFDCVDEIITALDKAEPKGGGTKGFDQQAHEAHQHSLFLYYLQS
jgi:hypothetical protein